MMWIYFLVGAVGGVCGAIIGVAGMVGWLQWKMLQDPPKPREDNE